jgi:hypothetical protein
MVMRFASQKRILRFDVLNWDYHNSTVYEAMAQISLEIPDELLQRLNQSGFNPDDFFQERLLALSTSMEVATPLARRFADLASRWRRETGHMSLMSDVVMNTAYQQIIGMGTPVVGLILQDLKREPDHWFWALRSITGENPVDQGDRGRVGKMAEAWLEWGRRNGYQC